MAKCAVICSFNSGFATSTNDFIISLCNTSPAGLSTAAAAGYYFQIAGTITALGLFINATGSGRQYNYVLDGGATDLQIAVSDGDSGWKTDTGTINVVDDSDVCIDVVETGTNPTVYTYRTLFQATTDHAYLTGSNHVQGTGNSTTYYLPIGGSIAGLSTTLANNQHTIRAAGTLQNFFGSYTSNTRTTDTVITSNVDGSPGNITITVAGAATGLHEDTTHTDTLADGALVCYQVVTGASGGGNLAGRTGCAVVNATGVSDTFWGRADVQNRVASATTHYIPIGGRYAVNVTDETLCYADMGFVGTFSKLRVYVAIESYTADATLTLRVGGSDTSVVLTLNATGWFEDTTHEAAFGATDLCAISIVGGTSGNMSLGMGAVTYSEPATGQPTVKRFGGVRHMPSLSPVGEHSKSIRVW